MLSAKRGHRPAGVERAVDRVDHDPVGPAPSPKATSPRSSETAVNCDPAAWSASSSANTMSSACAVDHQRAVAALADPVVLGARAIPGSGEQLGLGGDHPAAGRDPVGSSGSPGSPALERVRGHRGDASPLGLMDGARGDADPADRGAAARGRASRRAVLVLGERRLRPQRGAGAPPRLAGLAGLAARTRAGAGPAPAPPPPGCATAPRPSWTPVRGALGPHLRGVAERLLREYAVRGRPRPVLRRRRAPRPPGDPARPRRRSAASPARDPRQPGRPAGPAAAPDRPAEARGRRPRPRCAIGRRSGSAAPRRRRAGARPARDRVRRALRAPRPDPARGRQPRRRRSPARARPAVRATAPTSPTSSPPASTT